ncbi:hypothetical protein, partial [Pseudomonas sp. 30_B]|uniref:hypothetical protein n=1 Tax=Pseudomonas sp. 30_B TaxID=2813575 RepID=UPI001A9E236A
MKPSRAASAKRSRNAFSFYIIGRLAAKRGMASVPGPVGERGGEGAPERARRRRRSIIYRLTSFAGVSHTASAPITSIAASTYMP